MLRRTFAVSVVVFLFAQAELGAVETLKLSSRIPENAVGAVFIRDLPELARGNAWMSGLSEAFVGEVAFALLDIPRERTAPVPPPPQGPPGAPPAPPGAPREKTIPPFVIMGQVKPEKLEQFLAVRLKPMLSRNLGKVEFNSSEGITEILVNDSPTAFYSIKNDLLCFSLNKEIVANFVAKALPNEKSLRANPAFGKVLARTPASSRSIYFVNVKRILGIFGDKISEETRAGLKAAGVLDVEAIGGYDEVIDGAPTGAVSLITSGKPSGFLALASQAAAPPTTARFIPADYSLYARLRFSSFSDAWRQVAQTLKEIAAQAKGEGEEETGAKEETPVAEEEPGEEEKPEERGDGIAGFLEGFREATGLDFVKDVLDSMGGEAAVAVAVPETLRIPDAVGLLEVVNRTKIEQVISKILPAATAEAEQYKGVAIRALNIGRFEGAYAFVEKYLVVGTNVSAVKSVVDVAGGAAALADNPKFELAMERLGGGSHLLYLDAGSALPIVLSAISRGLESFSEEEADSEGPRWEVIGKLLISPLLTDVVLGCAILGDDESVTIRGYSTIRGTYNWMATSSIMAGMMLPALSRARESARQAVCINNLKQIVTAQHLYANDYDGKFTDKLSDLYPHYVTSLRVFTCPSATEAEITEKEDIDSLASYVLRKGLTRDSAADQILLYEKIENHRRRGGNVAYVDGHVRWLDVEELEELPAEGQEK
jgi:prepilin-type processing-associated H-X9-DG protein